MENKDLKSTFYSTTRNLNFDESRRPELDLTGYSNSVTPKTRNIKAKVKNDKQQGSDEIIISSTERRHENRSIKLKSIHR